ncbi:MAG: hypothetical protein U1F59_09770 [Candidatus Competibacteraceae bacterium]
MANMTRDDRAVWIADVLMVLADLCEASRALDRDGHQRILTGLRALHPAPARTAGVVPFPATGGSRPPLAGKFSPR